MGMIQVVEWNFMSGLCTCDGKESFPDFIVLFDEATFKLNGTLSQHNYVYCASENPCVTEEQAVSLAGVSLWCSMSSRGLIGTFFFEATVTGAAYLSVL
jgi:hypothetical protein